MPFFWNVQDRRKFSILSTFYFACLKLQEEHEPWEGWQDHVKDGESYLNTSQTLQSAAPTFSPIYGGGCGGVVSIATPSIPSPKTKPKL